MKAHSLSAVCPSVISVVSVRPKQYTVGMDNRATIFVWNWQKGAVLAECTGGNSLPPFVWGLVAHPTADEFISYGCEKDSIILTL